MVNGSGGGQQVADNNYVWWNDISHQGHWIEVRVRSASDPMGPLGLGAKVTVYRAGTHQILGDDEMRTDFGYRSRRDAVLHFGLGKVDKVDVRVQGEGLGTPVTVHNLRADRPVTITMPPQAPVLVGGARHNAGRFSLTWAPLGSNTGFTYTLQHRKEGGNWATVATGLTKSHYQFTKASPERRGAWTYRVIATYAGTPSNPSPASAAIVVRF